MYTTRTGGLELYPESRLILAESMTKNPVKSLSVFKMFDYGGKCTQWQQGIVRPLANMGAE